MKFFDSKNGYNLQMNRRQRYNKFKSFCLAHSVDKNMESVYDEMAKKIRKLRNELSSDKQLLIGIAGPPGVGIGTE